MNGPIAAIQPEKIGGAGQGLPPLPAPHQRSREDRMATPKLTLEQRLWSRVEKLPDAPGCWLWTGAEHSAGYGVINLGSGKGLAYTHRLVYSLTFGVTLDSTTHVHHKCRVKACCNPDHLEDLGASEHSQEHADERKAATVCAKGHTMADAYVRKSNGQRMCRHCRRAAVIKNATVGSRRRGERRAL